MGGRGLGGRGAINNMVYIRGNPDDFNYWENCDNPTWEWENMLKYFKRSENNRFLPIAANSYHHSISGPAPVDNFHGNSIAKVLLKEATKELGIRELFDVNADRYIGMVQAQGTIDKNTRSSTAKAFLTGPVGRRTNLHIIKNAFVLNLKFKPDGSVSGARFLLKDKLFQPTATKEVIISAGPIMTPKILMMSGIGPAKYLKKRSIKVRHDLPVGKNFQDHVMVPLIIKIGRSQSHSNNPIKEMINDGYAYFVQNDGDLASIGVRDLYTFINVENAKSPYPNIQITYEYYFRKDRELFDILTNLGYTDDIINEICQKNIKYDLAILYVTLLTPYSRGFVGVKSAEPGDPPKIRTNYLGDDRDFGILQKGLQFARQIPSTKAAQIFQAKELPLNVPGCKRFTHSSSNYWECYIRHMTISGRQTAGTTKMGPACDNDTVVDSQMRVYNVKHLRIISSSIMPRIVRAPIYATQMAIAEKGAAFIIDAWKNYN